MISWRGSLGVYLYRDAQRVLYGGESNDYDAYTLSNWVYGWNADVP